MATDEVRHSIHILYSMLSMRHSLMMRKAVSSSEVVDEIRVAVASEMMNYLSANLMLVRENYEEFTEWFMQNTPVEVQQACYNSVSSET